MPTNTTDLDIDRSRTRHRVTGRVADLACFDVRRVVQRNREIGFWEIGVEVVAQHRVRAVAGFFGWLAEHHERAGPLAFQLGQHLRGAEKARHVDVVTTSVHHAHFDTRIVFSLDLTRIRQSGLLFDWQGVELGSDENGRAWTILQHCHNTVAGPLRVLILADAFCDGEAKLAQLAGDKGRRLFLAMRKLWRCVQITIGGKPRRDVAIDHRVERELLCVDGHGEQTKTCENTQSFRHYLTPIRADLLLTYPSNPRLWLWW